MSLPTIVLDNTTTSDIVLRQLGVTVPASGSYTVSDFNSPSAILNDEQLQTALDAGDITVTYMADVLTSEQSRALIQPITALDIKHNLMALAPPGVGDDDVAGYSVGSNWIDTVGGSAFQCVDDTTGAANWVPSGSSGGEKVVFCAFGGKLDGQGKFAIANGKSSDADDSSKPKTRQPIPFTGTITVLSYKTKEAESTTRMKIHVNGSVQAAILLSNINANYGGVETTDSGGGPLSVSVTAGDYVELEWDGPSGKKPGESTWILGGEAS
jgi:hypothetical protein